MKDFLHIGNYFAVVGATQNKEKYGYKVLKKLDGNRLDVVGVNPKYTDIEGIECFGKLADVDPVPDVVVTVVPPEVTENIVRQCIDLGIKRIWMQPGSESETAVELATQAGMDVVSGACIVVDGLGQEWGSGG